ncbi:ABC transporter ATP-binding protein [Lysobacter capsici]|uniref:ABC transporter ATP-binding protein n=1 Tax=Lysobacter capsici TaxID=435897 RepID=UPI001BFFE111|nr:ABC transporter ATP-binding protein [Lysobacter capsici]QWF15860.1 ABC transporter ATP-binding protein [Lysobacter capsici]
MTAVLRASNIVLELPLDQQREFRGESASSFRATLGRSSRRYKTILSGIGFEAKEGDRIAVMGLNGAGKSTLLRVLNGAFPPTHGSVYSRGSMQSLLNSSIGFHEYASVSENVFLRGTAMGLRIRQLQAALDDILTFAGLKDCAAHRLHTLSAGQRTRLGFAISTAVQPDILLMDEWLATGDASFIERARERMLGRFHDSRIVVLASHSTSLQREMCTKALVLDQGRMRYFGGIETGIECYREIAAGVSAKLRQQLVESDPLIFGDSIGAIEQVRGDGRRLLIEGWAVSAGNEAKSLSFELDGVRRIVAQFERVERDDVRRFLAKKAGKYGFRFTVDEVDMHDLPALAARILVSVGNSPQNLGAPLPLVASPIIKYGLE